MVTKGVPAPYRLPYILYFGISRTYLHLSRTYLPLAEHIGHSVGHTYPQPNISATQSDILTLGRNIAATQSDILNLSRSYRPLSRTYLTSADHIGHSVGHTYPQPNISASQSDILTLSRTYRPLSRTYLTSADHIGHSVGHTYPRAQHIGHAVGDTVFAIKTSCMDHQKLTVPLKIKQWNVRAGIKVQPVWRQR
jgi:hypothetical protein